MELRHLRYFIAVAEEGSLTLAAEKRLHTAQPSLSRQIRDLEYEVGVQLMRGKLDIAFLRPEQKPDLEYKLVAKEPLVVILPSDHSLAGRKAIDPHDLVGETFIGVSNTPRVLRHRRLPQAIWNRDRART
jgi:DNA-binding transcriptional LysR family regulator